MSNTDFGENLVAVYLLVCWFVCLGIGYHQAVLWLCTQTSLLSNSMTSKVVIWEPYRMSAIEPDFTACKNSAFKTCTISILDTKSEIYRKKGKGQVSHTY